MREHARQNRIYITAGVVLLLLLGMAILCFSCFAENSASGVFLATFGLVPRLFILLELFESNLPNLQNLFLSI